MILNKPSLLVLSLLTSQSLWAAPSAKVIDLLSLPVQNRLLVAEKRKADLMPELTQVAFDTNNNMDVRWNSLSLAAHLEPQKAEALAARAIKADEWFMRNAGLVVLSAMGSEQLKGQSLKLLKDPALVVRSAAVEGLAPMASGDSEVRKALWAELFEARNFRKGQSLWIRKQIG